LMLLDRQGYKALMVYRAGLADRGKYRCNRLRI
jgi:hypothetical protein